MSVTVLTIAENEHTTSAVVTDENDEEMIIFISWLLPFQSGHSDHFILLSSLVSHSPHPPPGVSKNNPHPIHTPDDVAAL